MTLTTITPPSVTTYWPCDRCGVVPMPPRRAALTRVGYLCATCRGEEIVPARAHPPQLPAAVLLDPNRIRMARKAADLTAASVARTLGVSRDAVVQWEAGLRHPSPSTQHALASALGCNVVTFFAAA